MKKHRPFASALRQLHHLQKQVKRQGLDSLDSSSYQKLVVKFRKLVRRLQQAVHAKYWIRQAVAVALFLHLSLAEVTGQQYSGPQINPFGLGDTQDLYLYKAVDLDGDGDYDIIGMGWNYDEERLGLQYFRNVGSPSNPNFAPPTQSVFGINPSVVGTMYFFADFADMDNDGDLDMIAFIDYYGYEQEFAYFENTGTKTSPQFKLDHKFKPVGDYLNGVGLPILADLDDDGDIDILQSAYTEYTVVNGYNEYHYFGHKIVYTENKGTPEDFAFEETVLQPFGIAPNANNILAAISLGDLDGDGDLDLLSCDMNIEGGVFPNFYYQENIGSASDPQFGPEQFKPFGLFTEATVFQFPQLVDFDFDGDLDILSTSNDIIKEVVNIHYFENLGPDAVQDLSELGVEMQISPNPASEYLAVTTHGLAGFSGSVIELYDNSGRLVLSQNLEGETVILETEDLPAGTYVLRLINPAGQLSRPVVFAH